MKRTNDNTRIVELFVKAGLVAAIAAALLAPTTIRAGSNETALNADHAWPMPRRASCNALPLPPIAHLETMPWLKLERAARPIKIDTLLAPPFEMMGPTVARSGSDARLSSTPGLSGNG